MIGIIKKNIAFYLVYGIFFLIVSTAMWYSAMDRLRPPIAVINSYFMFFMAVVPALTAEAAEEKYRGYAFLMTLPLKLDTVVRVKMALPAAAVAVSLAYNLVFFHFFQSSPSVMADCVKIMLLSASIMMVISGAVFLLLYRYSVRSMMMGLVFAGVIFNFLGLVAARTRGALNIFELPEIIVSGRPLALFAAMPIVSLGIYHIFFRKAVALKEERLFD